MHITMISFSSYWQTVLLTRIAFCHPRDLLNNGEDLIANLFANLTNGLKNVGSNSASFEGGPFGNIEGILVSAVAVVLIMYAFASRLSREVIGFV